MMPDAEVVTVIAEVLSSLPIGGFTIKLNHRGLLDAVLDIAGVPAAKFRPICSAIDKLDKEPWAAVREEMISEKGLAPAVADRIGEMVVLNGRPQELLARLQRDAVFGECTTAYPGARRVLCPHTCPHLCFVALRRQPRRRRRRARLALHPVCVPGGDGQHRPRHL